MEIYSLDSVGSTQRYLVDRIKKGEWHPPVALYAKHQTQGMGSRGNGWVALSGNLFLSFALLRSSLSQDLKIESASIYFAWLMKDFLAAQGSACVIKWPNDLYVGPKKVGGVITTLVGESFVCGIGLNLAAAPRGFGKLDIALGVEDCVEGFLKKLQSPPSWKQVFSKYSVEFYQNRALWAHDGEGRRVALGDATLCEDGSIMINNKRIYSLR